MCKNNQHLLTKNILPSKGLPGPLPQDIKWSLYWEDYLKKMRIWVYKNECISGYIIAHSHLTIYQFITSSGGWKRASSEAALQTWTEALSRGVGVEETSCHFDPEFQSRVRAGVTNIRRNHYTNVSSNLSKIQYNQPNNVEYNTDLCKVRAEFFKQKYYI